MTGNTPPPKVATSEPLVNEAAEINVLLCIMCQGQLLEDAAKYLLPEMFTDPMRRGLFNLFSEMLKRRGDQIYELTFDPPSVQRVVAELEQRRRLAFERGGLAAMIKLFNVRGRADIPGFLNSVQQVLHMHQRRQFVRFGDEIRNAALDFGEHPTLESLSAKATVEMVHLTSQSRIDEGSITPLGMDPRDYYELQEMKIQQGAEGLLGVRCAHFPTWMSHMSDIGFPRGSLTTIVARPKTGKTTLLQTLAMKVAMQGIPVLYLDNEMTHQELYTRGIAHMSGENESAIIQGRMVSEHPNPLGDDSRQRVLHAMGNMHRLPMYYSNVASMDPSSVVSIIREFFQNHVKYGNLVHERTGRVWKRANPALVVFDWMKIPQVNNGNMQEWQALGHLASRIKNSAVAFDLAVVAGAQANRQASGSTADDYHSDPDRFVGGSDRLNQFSSSVVHMRDLFEDERRSMMTYRPESETSKDWFPDLSPAEQQFVDQNGLGPLVRTEWVRGVMSTGGLVDYTDREATIVNQRLHIRYNRNGSQCMQGIPLFHAFGRFTYDEMARDPRIIAYELWRRQKRQAERQQKSNKKSFGAAIGKAGG